MKIIGLDNSLSSPGVVKAELDDNLDIINMDYLTFTTVKKYSGGNIIHYKKKDFRSDVDEYLYKRDEIYNFCGDADYMALEDYAFNASGQITKLAESVGSLIVLFYEKYTKIRKYNISIIKIFATSKGNSDKISMEKYYDLYKEEKFNLSYLPMVHEKKSNNPKDNIIDAYYIMKMLQIELKVRTGIIRLHELSSDILRCFNRVTKSEPLNLPVRPFIEKIK